MGFFLNHSTSHKSSQRELGMMFSWHAPVCLHWLSKYWNTSIWVRWLVLPWTSKAPIHYPPWLLLQSRVWHSKDLQYHPASAPGPAPERDWGPHLKLSVKYFEYHPEWGGCGDVLRFSRVIRVLTWILALGSIPCPCAKALFRMSFKYTTMMQLRPSVP